LAAKLGLGEQVRASLRQSYERWDGKGAYGLHGDQIAMSSRLINLADVVEVFRRTGGIDAAVAVARERSGTQFDPDLVEMFCRQAPLIFGDLDTAASWDLVIDAEPSLATAVSGIELDDALSAIGEFAELKSPWLMGHARGVAELAADAGRSGGLPQADVSSLRRAAFVHDVGRLGVSNTIWDKPASLTRSELERVRLHPYLTERMLSFSPGLAPLGAIAGQHHERLDGSGYPRGVSGDAITSVGRILAAADSAKRSPRPAHTGHPGRRRTPPPSYVPGSAPGAWMAPRWTRCCSYSVASQFWSRTEPRRRRLPRPRPHTDRDGLADDHRPCGSRARGRAPIPR
jgi:HD-GYP domain-containing protein (c-di-GMP phosphodiesterase class II)